VAAQWAASQEGLSSMSEAGSVNNTYDNTDVFYLRINFCERDICYVKRNCNNVNVSHFFNGTVTPTNFTSARQKMKQLEALITKNKSSEKISLLFLIRHGQHTKRRFQQFSAAAGMCLPRCSLATISGNTHILIGGICEVRH
jgi:hypothetical protein